MNENAKIITEYVNSWSKIPVGEIADFFTEDALYYTVPGYEPLKGREAIRRDMTVESETISADREFGVEILNIVAEGDVVMLERREWVNSPKSKIDFRAMTVFHMEGGKIKLSRTYFDQDLGARVDPKQSKGWVKKQDG